MYIVFVTDVYSRRILGCVMSDSMRTEALPLQALNQAIVCAKETTGLFYQLDHGLQYVSIVYSKGLAEHDIAASTGTVGDSYDNALAENVNGSYKNEIISSRSWNDVVMWKSPRSSGLTGGINHGSTRAWTTAPRLKQKPNFGNTTTVKKQWKSRHKPRNKTRGTSPYCCTSPNQSLAPNASYHLQLLCYGTVVTPA